MSHPADICQVGFRRMVQLSRHLMNPKRHIQVFLQEVVSAEEMHALFRRSKRDEWVAYAVDMSLAETQLFLDVVG